MIGPAVGEDLKVNRTTSPHLGKICHNTQLCGFPAAHWTTWTTRSRSSAFMLTAVRFRPNRPLPAPAEDEQFCPEADSQGGILGSAEWGGKRGIPDLPGLGCPGRKADLHTLGTRIVARRRDWLMSPSRRSPAAGRTGTARGPRGCAKADRSARPGG
jgi:hypothetical protein